jgi:hypothetical protein
MMKMPWEEDYSQAPKAAKMPWEEDYNEPQQQLTGMRAEKGMDTNGGRSYWDSHKSGDIRFSQLSPQDQQATIIEARARNQLPEGGGQAVTKGVLMNWNDEIAGGIAAPIQSGLKALGVARYGGNSIAENYQDNVALSRAAQKEYEQANPKTALAAEVLGGLATAPLAFSVRGAGIGANIAANAKTGGVMGAVAGFGEGEGLQDSAKHAGLGALLGAGVGGGLTGLGGGIAKAYQSYKANPSERALNMVTEAAKKEGISEQQLFQKMSELGDDAVLADVLGKRGHSLMSAANTVSPDARQIIETTLGARAAAKADRVSGALEEATGYGGKGVKSLKDEINEGAQPAIRDAYAAVKDVNVTLPEHIMKSETFQRLDSELLKKSRDTWNMPREEVMPKASAPSKTHSVSDDVSQVYAGNKPIDVKYEVVDRSSLVTSHDGFGRANKGYPQELQPRDRSSAASELQINEIANNFTPSRLGKSNDANAGAPIVGLDNIVESGNGRTLAIGKAYSQGKGEQYKDFLKSQGYNIDGMKEPVLVARRQGNMTAQERAAYAQGLGGTSGLKMSPVEIASKDANKVNGELLNSLSEQGEAALNPSFVKGFFRDVPISEAGAYIDKNGVLTQGGRDRINAAVLKKAYGDDNLVARAFESSDELGKTLNDALVGSASNWAKMKDAIAKGDISKDADLTGDLLNVVNRAMQAKKNGRPYGEYLNQTDLDKPMAMPEFVDLLFKGDGSLRSKNAIAENLKNYAQQSTGNLGNPLFGEPALSSQDILKNILAKAGDSGASKIAPQAQELVAEGVKKEARDNLVNTLIGNKRSLSHLDLLKRELDNKAGISFRAGDNLSGKEASLKAGDLRNLIDEADPQHSVARALFKAMKGKQEAVDIGAKSLNFKKDAIAAIEANPNKQELAHGFAAAFGDKLGGANATTAINSLYRPNAAEIVQKVLGEKAAKFQGQINAERVFDNTASKVGGSRTAEKYYDAAALGAGGLYDYANGGHSLLSGSATGLGLAALRRGGKHLQDKRAAQIAPKIAEILMSGKPPTLAQLKGMTPTERITYQVLAQNSTRQLTEKRH